MEKEPWIYRLVKHQWTPIILGAVVCLGVIAIAKANAAEAIPAGLGIVCFAFIAMVKLFSK